MSRTGRKFIGHTVNTELPKVVSKLRYNVKDRRRFSNPEGPEGRHDKIRKTITALLKHERIELNYYLGDESRGYAERLISDAIRYGDAHRETMERANYWISEKQIVHKLFKVIAPKYKDYLISYTRMWKAPTIYPGFHRNKCVLELRNNIYPSLEPVNSRNPLFLHNVLLNEARLEFKRSEMSKLVEELKKDEVEARKVKSAETENEMPDISSMKLSVENSDEKLDNVESTDAKKEPESSNKVEPETDNVKKEKADTNLEKHQTENKPDEKPSG